MKKIHHLLLMAGMILFFPLNSHAQYELGYAVFHLSQKMLSEPEIVKGIDNVLYHPITLTARPKGFNKLKSAELNLLVEQYKQTDFMQNYYDELFNIAAKKGLDSKELEKFVQDTENISEVNDLQSALSSMLDTYVVEFRKIVYKNIGNDKSLKQIKLEAPQWFVDDYKDVIDTLIAREKPFNYDNAKLYYEDIFKFPKEKAQEKANECVKYLDNNLFVYFANSLYSFFPQKEEMDMVRCGLKVKGYDKFCKGIQIESIKFMLSKSFYDWCEKDNRIKKAIKLVKEQGLTSEPHVVKVNREKHYYGYMGQVTLISGDYDEGPTYIGGDEAMMEYIRTHWEVPAIAQRNKITSKIYVGFDVEKDGTVTNAEILCNDSYANFKLKLESAMCDSIDAKNAKNVKESLDALESNVLKVVRGIKKMNPAKKNGEPVKCRYSIPFTYYL